jgi:hypothetical protein
MSPGEIRRLEADSLAAYLETRREALESLDETRIRAWCDRYGLRWPTGQGFWVHVHRMRLSWDLMGLPQAERDRSQAWLDRVAQAQGKLFWEEPEPQNCKRNWPPSDGADEEDAQEGHGAGNLPRGEDMDTRIFRTPSQYLKVVDVTKPLLLTISGTETRQFDDDERLALTFKGDDRRLTLNQTNLRFLQATWGFDTEDWAGKKVVVYVDKSVSYGGVTGGLRLREPDPESTGGSSSPAMRAQAARLRSVQEDLQADTDAFIQQQVLGDEQKPADQTGVPF